jgi:hypothetical protein
LPVAPAVTIAPPSNVTLSAFNAKLGAAELATGKANCDFDTTAFAGSAARPIPSFLIRYLEFFRRFRWQTHL